MNFESRLQCCNSRIASSHVVRFGAHAFRPAKQGTNECGYRSKLVFVCGDWLSSFRRNTCEEQRPGRAEGQSESIAMDFGFESNHKIDAQDKSHRPHFVVVFRMAFLAEREVYQAKMPQLWLSEYAGKMAHLCRESAP